MALGTIDTNQIASEAVTVPKVTDQVLSNRNFIINGDMQVWQRATAATTVTNAYATVDRYKFTENTSGAFSSERSTDTPTGTGYSLKLQVTTADTSMAAGDYAYVVQVIEAQNLQPLQYGTSSAKTLTLSFWVKSSLTGTYSVALGKVDNTVYIFVHEYTISQANTWEKKTITISPTAGSTSFITSAAGAIDNDNGQGLALYWWLCSGTDLNGGTSNAWSSTTTHYTTTNIVNWFNSTSNNFYLAQAQLEIGDVATPFQHEDYATTLRKCKRYYELLDTTVYPTKYSTVSLGNFFWTEQKRAQPTLTADANTGSQTLNPIYTSGGYIYKSSETTSPIEGMRGDAEL
tara:strand:- start:1639 stop:2676 length:1038 start_codon:yes stop_codon:yes gene_type:complete